MDPIWKNMIRTMHPHDFTRNLALTIRPRWPACLTARPSMVRPARPALPTKSTTYSATTARTPTAAAVTRATWLRDKLPAGSYKVIINTKRAIFGPHEGPFMRTDNA